MDLRLATELLLGFHLCESCLKLNEDCLKKFVDDNAKESEEQLKGVTEDVAELKLIIRTTDELVGAINEQGKQIEELQQNLKELNKVSMKKLNENKQETKQWSSLFENKVETLITDIENVQGSVTDTKSKIEMNNERQRRQNNIIVYNLTEDVGKSKEKELVSKLLKEVTSRKSRKRNLGNVQNWKKKLKNLQNQGLVVKI